MPRDKLPRPDRRQRIAVVDPRPPGVPRTSDLHPTARAMLDDYLVELASMLTGRADGPRPEYVLTTTDDERLCLSLVVTFDPASLNGFARAVKGE